jgi:hypothetical protein
MSTSDFLLATPPAAERQRGLWLQHAAGFIFFEDARRYALSRLDPALDERAREAAVRAIDDALYGMMMIADGVTGALRSEEHRVQLQVTAELVQLVDGKETIVQQLDLREGDGMCMGYHAWCEGDFGSAPIVVSAAERTRGTMGGT